MSELNSRQEYLKRYLDGYKPQSRKKKVKSKSSHKQSRIKIVDEDIDIKKIEPSNHDEEVGDESPLVVDVIDERPDHVKISEMYSCVRWKKLESSVTGEEASISSHQDSKDSSEPKQKNPECVLNADINHSAEQLSPKNTKHYLNIITSPLRKQLKDEFHSKKLGDSACKTKSHNASADFSPSINFSKEGNSEKSSDRANESVRQHDSDSDFSPARRKSSEVTHGMLEHSASDEDIVRKQCNSDDDLSPPRGRVKSSAVVWNSSDSKNLPKVRHDSDSDISPPRAKSSGLSDSDLSPPRSKADSQNHKQKDFSPLRKNVKQHSGSPSASPKRTRGKIQHSSDSDFSPPREKISTSSVIKRQDSNAGARIRKTESQTRKSKLSPQSSPPPEKLSRKNVKRGHGSDGDSSPSRNRQQNFSERKTSESSHSSRHKRKSHRREKNHQEAHTSASSDLKRKCPTSTLSGMKAGLQDATMLREETRTFKQQERQAINELSDELSGRNAETIARDKDTGKRRNLKEEKLRQKEEEKKNAAKQEKYLEWGKGLKQKDDQQKRLEQDMYEMSKPLARYADDEDLERELKNELREGDPMLEYAKKKRQKNQPVAASLPVYQGPPPPLNRFNILPGYRWDGVDRSNGFEKKFFEKVNDAKAKEHEAYLWSIENM